MLPVVNNVLFFGCVACVNEIRSRAVDPVNFLIVILIHFAHGSPKLFCRLTIVLKLHHTPPYWAFHWLESDFLGDINPLQSRTRLKLSIQVFAKYFKHRADLHMCVLTLLNNRANNLAQYTKQQSSRSPALELLRMLANVFVVADCLFLKASQSWMDQNFTAGETSILVFHASASVQ